MKQTITIVALSTPHTISIRALDRVLSAPKVYLQTIESPCALPVLDEGIPHATMDDLYASALDFDALNQAVAARLTQAGSCVYGVYGRGIGMAQLQAIQDAATNSGHLVEYFPGAGYGDAAMASLSCEDQMHLLQGGHLQYLANELAPPFDSRMTLLVEELDNPLLAGDVKLALGDFYPEDWPVHLCSMQLDGSYLPTTMPLYQIDRAKDYAAATVLIVPKVDFGQLTSYGYDDLDTIVTILRSPEGCPWDREQTHVSLKASLIEEAYEVLDAIDQGDDAALCEELGDLLLQCAMHAGIAAEQARFTSRDMTTGIVKKLMYRHPHVFSKEELPTSDAVVARWEDLKKLEKHFDSQTAVMEAVPRNLPSLMRSAKVQKKAAQVGFDWKAPEEALYKVLEEVEELRQAMIQDSNISEEVGDLLFAVVNVCRLLRLEPELMLLDATDKFIQRFADMERLSRKNGQDLQDLSRNEQEALWVLAKNE